MDNPYVNQVQVTALNPVEQQFQLDFFAKPDVKRAALNKIVDSINARYGEFAIAPAPLLTHSEQPNVISPAWKPSGHRQSI